MGDSCAQSPALPPRVVIVCSTLPFVGVVVVLVAVQAGPAAVVVVVLFLSLLLLCLFSLLFAEFVIYQKKEKNPKRNDNKNV